MTEPINPGPLVRSDFRGPGDELGDSVIALDLVDGATDAPDHGYLFDMIPRPDWQGHLAWIVRASNSHKELAGALENLMAAGHQDMPLYYKRIEEARAALAKAGYNREERSKP